MNAIDRPAAPKLTKRQRAFVETLVETRRLSAALSASGFTAFELQKDRNRFSYFAECCAAAERVALNDAAYTRAVEGVLVPKFHEGVVIGHVREYSDSLLLALLKARGGEEFQDRRHVEIHKTTTNRVSLSTVSPKQIESARAALLAALPAPAEKPIDAEFTEVPAVTLEDIL